MQTIPTYSADIYSRSAILEPYPHYARLRDLGPVVSLRKQRILAAPRYTECRTILSDDETFVSGEGVGLNPIVNAMSRDSTLHSDGADHAKKRRLVGHRLTPRALTTLQADVDAAAATVVDTAIVKGRIDGVTDLAMALPLAVVPDLIGWPQEGRENLIRWAAGTFDALGPINRRSFAGVVPSLGMLRFARNLAKNASVTPGSLGAEVLAAVERGDVPQAQGSGLMVDYLAPSLDTTLSAISTALHLFATHPDQWEEVRGDRSLLRNAVNEVVRIEAPVRAFSRVAARDTELSGVPIAAGTRLLVMFGSANRDERQWDRPDAFDIHRDATAQLGFGYGTHGCAGQGLARLEIQALLNALLDRVDRIRLDGEPQWALNNVIRRLGRLPLRLEPITTAA